MADIFTLKDLIYRADKEFGDKDCVLEAEKKEIISKSFHQIRKDSDALASWILSEFKSNVHAAIIGPTSSEYITVFFGIQCSGNTAVPLDNSNYAEKIADEINRSDSEIVFIEKTHYGDIEKFRELCPAVKIFVHMKEKTDDTLYLADIINDFSDSVPDSEPKEDDIAAILFTSGTTGKSKGVMLSNGNLIDNTTCEPNQIEHDTKRLTVLPIHHVFCLTCDILCSFWFGKTICVNDSLMRIPKNLKLFQPTSVTFVPMIAASILTRMQQIAKNGTDKKAVAKDFFGESFDVIYAGGAYLSEEIINGYKDFGIEITQGYGMTECSPRICNGKVNSEAPTSVGEIVPGCQVKIEDGEILVKSKSVMKGYYKNPEETAKSLTPDGWLRTGDLGYKDDKGYLYITGRKKNLIILSNGENVSPEEIENQFACFEPIKEIVVYAKDGRITAEVYANPEYHSDDIQAEIQAKIDEVNSTFPTAKHIVSLILRDTEFEKTTSKKIIRPSFT